jgi:predicted Zn-ribbon and HTH transcriptional regulator
VSRRERIIELLTATEEPMDVGEIARELGLDPREAASIYEDLEHIARSLKNSGFVLLVQPPACKSCGYVFRDLKRLKKPSKCPRCRSERIYPPRFIIRPRDERG